MTMAATLDACSLLTRPCLVRSVSRRTASWPTRRDYRDLPVGKGAYIKIVSLEMAEHVCIRRYSQVIRLVPHGGSRTSSGLFINKHIFTDADVSYD
ncbi:hypothetical protein H2248_003332 [Termitomyces sp. 'cryptogamus']|nr:hypothetical protein H2248_003332 [Termitomyces sp. 'cryptogamus']